MSQRVVFITGTDTGVGKTVLTALLLIHAQNRAKGGVAAVKPFCSGGREDAELLFQLQEGTLPLDVINPFFFSEPLAPWTAARLNGGRIELKEVIAAIQEVKTDLLFIEGAGGLLAPLGECFTALELIRELEAEVIITAANRLGVINHTWLTLQALKGVTHPGVKVALMNGFPDEPSAMHNPGDIEKWTGIPVSLIPDLGMEPGISTLRSSAASLKPVLEQLLLPA